MKRSLSILMILIVLLAMNEKKSVAQLWKLRRYEASVGLGPSFFFGDIGGYSQGDNILGLKDVSFLQTRVNFNLNAKYRVLQDLNVRLSLTSGLLKATDARGSNITRGLESSISIFEPVVMGEYYFIKNRSENSWKFNKGKSRGLGGLLRSLDFYAFAGFGGLSYSATVSGMSEKQSGFTGIIPAGIGANLIFTQDFNFGAELSGRYSFSDYIDGYSSQYSRSNDVYYFLNFTFTYKLKTGPNGLPSFRR